MNKLEKFIKEEPLISLIVSGMFIIMILGIIAVFVIPSRYCFDGLIHTRQLIAYIYMATIFVWIFIAYKIYNKHNIFEIYIKNTKNGNNN